MSLFFAGIAVLVLGGLVTVFFRESGKLQVFCVAAGVSAVLVCSQAVPVLVSGTIAGFSVDLSEPFGSVRFEIDPLSAFFVILIAVQSFLASLYAIGYLKPYRNTGRPMTSHVLFLSVLVASMLLVVTVRNAIAFLVFWEAMSISSSFLVAFEHEKKETVQAAIYYVTAMHIGFLFLVAGFVLVSLRSGNPDFAGFANAFASDGAAGTLAFALFLIGFAFKAGFAPFHTWLPRAHSSAPTHVSALMSGVMIKTGIYGMLRTIIAAGKPGPAAGAAVLAVSVVTAIIGIIYSLQQKDMKKALAYSSVENIGIIGIGIGIGMLGLSFGDRTMAVLGFSGALFHTLNHSLFKSLLFYCVGAVYGQTHTRNMELLGGLSKKMPMTSHFAFVGILSICALPPFNGFYSEFLLYIGGARFLGFAGPVSIVIGALILASLAFVGSTAVLGFTRLYGIAFLGNPRSVAAEKANEPEGVMLVPAAIAAFLCLAAGVFASAFFSLFSTAVGGILGIEGFEASEAFAPSRELLSQLSLALLVFVAIAAILFLMRTVMLRGRSVTRHTTWGCGYPDYNPRMQYTASSFVSSYLKLYGIGRSGKKKADAPMALFPSEASREASFRDFVDHRIVDPAGKLIEKLLSLLGWIQSGKIQQYILYGLLALLASAIFVTVV
jgi:hydrogenase-4 component B